ncbi:retrovirus-related pol polyprotein from transposon TNT 1-94 [Tanacetum coccineum]
MSNTNNNLQTQTSNALRNAIIEAGGKDRPPMLAPGNYNPPYKFKWTEKTIPVAEGSSETTTEGYMENYKNVLQDIRYQLDAEAEVKAIERLKQGESINVQDLETNLYWEFRKFTSRDGESLESYYSRFYNMMNELVKNKCDVTNHQVNVQFLLQLQPKWQRFVTLVKQSQELKTVSYHKLYDIFKQHQNEVNELRAERLARTANPVYHPPKQFHWYVCLLTKLTIPQPDHNKPLPETEIKLTRGMTLMMNLKIRNWNHIIYTWHRFKSEHPEQPESVNDTYPNEQNDTNIPTDSLNMKPIIEESKNRNKFLELSNKTLIDKLKGEIENFKTKNKSLESSNNHFKEANNELSKTNQLMFKDLKKFQAELNRYHDVNYALKVEIDYAKAKGDLINEKELFAHQETISIMSQEKEAQKKFHKICEDKGLEKVITLENKIKILDDIVYKTGQSVQTMNMLNRNCKTSFGKHEFLKKTQRANPRLYDIEIILFIVDSGCSKHMTGNLKLLSNFMEKILGTVKFGNDRIASILGYGDLLLFGSLHVTFDLKGNDLLTAWFWHRRHSHLNFDTINLLSKYDIVTGLPKLKFIKDHICSSCELGKAKHESFKTKTTPSLKRRLQIPHMDFCGPMRVESFNGKKYMLVIVDDYSRYTWTYFLISKDETPEVLIDFLKLVQKGLHAQVRIVRTDKGMEFLNKTLHAYYAQEGIEHQMYNTRTPKQNGVVERRNCTLVEAARIMLSAAKVPLFF